MHYRRTYIPGGSYFFTVALADRKQSLLTDHVDLLKSAFMTVKNAHPFKIDAIVILPEHFHMIMTLPGDDVRYSMRLGLIKSYFSRGIDKSETRSISRQFKRERGIWQRRFWEHYIRDEPDFIKHINYIHYNPVKHALTLNPVDWKYSSIHRYIKQGLLPSNWSAAEDTLM